MSVSCSCSRNTLSVLFLGASEVDFQRAQVGLGLLSMSARPSAASPTLHILHEATETGPDITHLPSGALHVENKDCPPSRQPKHRQSKTLGTSALMLSVPEKEKSENYLKVFTFGHLVLVSLREKCS